jgi:hypothetical protein
VVIVALFDREQGEAGNGVREFPDQTKTNVVHAVVPKTKSFWGADTKASPFYEVRVSMFLLTCSLTEEEILLER